MNDILSLALVQLDQGHHLLEGLAQQSIVLPSHDGEEEGEMGALTSAITIQIQSQAHLVPKLAGVK